MNECKAMLSTKVSFFQTSGLCIQESNNFLCPEFNFELSLLLFNLHLYYLSYIWLALEIIPLGKQAFDKKFFICYSKLNSESPPN